MLPRPSRRSHLLKAFFGERRRAMLFVEGVVDVLNQLRNDFVDLVVLVGGLFGRTGNDQRSARFVDEDGVDFVDDGEVVAALDAIREVVLHVVAQIVEAEFVVGAVGDVGGVGGAALNVVEIVDDDADDEAEGAVERAHPFGVAAGEVVVDGDDVNAASGERVQCGGKRGDERLAFTGLHFGDFAFVQNHAADQLHVEMAHAQRAPTCFADQRKRRNDCGRECLLHLFAERRVGGIGVFQRRLYLFFERDETSLEVVVAERLDFGLESVDGRDERLQFFDVALVLGADKPRDYAVNNLCCIHELSSPFLTVFDRAVCLQTWEPLQTWN